MVQWSWKRYWSDKIEGHHTFIDEGSLKKEASEVLFHTDGGKSLLDFGCGSGQLLVYYAPEYERITGVDFSLSMLEKAEIRIKQFGYTNITLIHADDTSIWDQIDKPYDRIISYGVVQYLTKDQIDYFVNKSSTVLNMDGKIIFFMIIDPYLVDLWRAGLFSKKCNYFFVFFQFIKLKLLNFIRGGPDNKIMGYAYNTKVIEKIAEKYGFQMEYVKSMYSEYRYHAILSKNKN